jgi:hypothetical protein
MYCHTKLQDTTLSCVKVAYTWDVPHDNYVCVINCRNLWSSKQGGPLWYIRTVSWKTWNS